MSALNAHAAFNRIPCVSKPIGSIFQTLIDGLSSLSLPSMLWGVHCDSQQKLLTFSKIAIGSDLSQSSKSIVLSETKDLILKVDVLLNNKSVKIPCICTRVTNTQELNQLLLAMDDLKLCKYFSTNEENGCSIFNVPFTNVCGNCVNISNHLQASTTEKWVEAQVQGNDATSTTNGVCVININCILCQKIFKNDQQLKEHEKNHVAKNSNDEFECTICLVVSADLATTLEHYKDKHVSVKFIKCSMCECKFTNVQRLRRHVRSHTGFQAFTCDFCNEQFKSKLNLKQHNCMQRRKLGASKSFICSTCETKYATKHLLHQHQREHRLKLNFKCKTCKKRFDRSHELTAHKPHCNFLRMKYACCVCKQRFSCITQKVFHMKKIHSALCNTDLPVEASQFSPSGL